MKKKINKKLLKEIKIANEQVEKGDIIPHDEFWSMLDEFFNDVMPKIYYDYLWKDTENIR